MLGLEFQHEFWWDIIQSMIGTKHIAFKKRKEESGLGKKTENE